MSKKNPIYRHFLSSILIYLYILLCGCFGALSLFLTCCNAIMKFAWAGWKMPVLCLNQIKGRKTRLVHPVFCNSKLTLQLSFALDCSSEYFLEVVLKARQSWVLHKTFAAAAGGGERTDNIQKISTRGNVFVNLQNVFVQIIECICQNKKNVFVQIKKIYLSNLQHFA